MYTQLPHTKISYQNQTLINAFEKDESFLLELFYTRINDVKGSIANMLLTKNVK